MLQETVDIVSKEVEKRGADTHLERRDTGSARTIGEEIHPDILVCLNKRITQHPIVVTQSAVVHPRIDLPKKIGYLFDPRRYRWLAWSRFFKVPGGSTVATQNNRSRW